MKKVTLFTFLALSLSGCFRVEEPAYPPGGSGDQTFPNYDLHFLQLVWNQEHLEQLKTLTIDEPGGIYIQPNRIDTELQLFFQAKVEKQDPQGLKKAFREQMKNSSQWQGPHARIQTPTLACLQSDPSQPIEGFCLEPLKLALPNAHALALNLQWNDRLEIERSSFTSLLLRFREATTATLNETRGPLYVLQGSSPLQTKLEVKNHQGGIEVSSLAPLAEIRLSNISGPICLLMEASTGTAAWIDEELVPHLPYRSSEDCPK